MNLQEKQDVVGELNAKFGGSMATFLVDYQGCSCEELTGLRRELEPAGAEFLVIKNTLAKRAVESTDSAELSGKFVGPTAVVWSKEDPVTPAKVLSKFAKDKESFEIKGGVVEGSLVGVAEIEDLASLPSKEEIQAKLLALINAPATRLLQTVNAPAGELVRLLEAWRAEIEKK
jgi:large subunit ribosomal protein L10